MWKRENKGRPRYFSVEEIAQLKDFFSGHKHWYVGEMLNISLNTGMRRGEILQIGVKHIGIVSLQPYFCLRLKMVTTE